MFSRKKNTTQIDPLQRELYENARRRILQKKRLFRHFIVFIIGSLLFLTFMLLGYGSERTILGLNWFIISILFWAFLFVIHFCNVWLFSTFMGKEWTDRQMERLIAKQKQEIELIQKDVDLMYPKEELIKKKEGFIKNTMNKDLDKTDTSEGVVTMIAAAGENNALGKDNDLVWHLPDDFKRFKSLTTGHYIIMGRKTFETFPKLLPNRIHVVITRNTAYKAEGVIVVHTIEDALEVAKSDQQPFIIGGGEIYTMGMKHADCIELTRVHGEFEADAFFPEIDMNDWKLVKEEFHDKDDRHKYPFTYLTYKRK